jgi:hypothetical protein
MSKTTHFSDREYPIARQAGFGEGCQRSGARRVIAEVGREHGREAAKRRIVASRLDELFHFRVGDQP